MIKIYSTGSHKELSNYLIGKSKDTLIGILLDLLTMYINDKNSSTIREFLTVTLAGYTHKEGKIGYNGFKQDSFISGKTVMCEAKPRNFDYKDLIKCQILKTVYLLNNFCIFPSTKLTEKYTIYLRTKGANIWQKKQYQTRCQRKNVWNG